MCAKTVILELAHRNSQASVPFVLSDAGLWLSLAQPGCGTGDALLPILRNGMRKARNRWITGLPPAIRRMKSNKLMEMRQVSVPMMPEYGMGFWQCKLRYWNQEQLLKVAREYKERKIPIDVIVC